MILIVGEKFFRGSLYFSSVGAGFLFLRDRKKNFFFLFSHFEEEGSGIHRVKHSLLKIQKLCWP